MMDREEYDEEPGVGPVSGNLSVKEIIREARGTELPAGTPSFIPGIGGDGHSYLYPVVGVRKDGSLITTSWDARHRDDCRCSDPEAWY